MQLGARDKAGPARSVSAPSSRGMLAASSPPASSSHHHGQHHQHNRADTYPEEDEDEVGSPSSSSSSQMRLHSKSSFASATDEDEAQDFMDELLKDKKSGPWINLKALAWRSFLEIRDEIAGSVVYLDGPSEEMMKWNFGGAHVLLMLGAEDVKRMIEIKKEDGSSTTTKEKRQRSVSTVDASGGSNIGGDEASRAENGADSDDPVDGPRRVLFFISSYLPEYKDQIKAVLQERPFEECLVYTALPEKAHSHYPELGGGLFHSYESMMKDWMRRKRGKSLACVAVVLPFTAGWSAGIPHSFLLPACHDAFPVMPLPHAGDEDQQEEDDEQAAGSLRASKGQEISLKRLVYTLSSLLRAAEVREEVYAIGRTSTQLGSDLLKLAQQSQSTSPTGSVLSSSAGNPSPTGSLARPASLILVDRTLDLVGPLLHTENMLERILDAYPRIAPHSMDINLDLRPLIPNMPSTGSSAATQQFLLDEEFVPVGSLAGGSGAEAALSSMALKPPKKALNSLRKKLIDALAHERINPDLRLSTGSINATRLSSIVRQLQAASGGGGFYRHCGLVQCTAAAAQALQANTEEARRRAELSSIEKVLLVTALDPAHSSPLQQLTDLLAHGKFSVLEVACLAMLCYSLLGPGHQMQSSDEKAFRLALTDALLNTPQDSLEWLEDQEIIGYLEKRYARLRDKEQQAESQVETSEVAEDDEEERIAAMQLKFQLKDRLQEVLERMRYIAEIRAPFRDYKQVLHKAVTGPTYEALLTQIAKDVLEPKRDLHDLQKVTLGSLVNFITSGLGRFGFSQKSKPRPADNPLLIFFVVGGITCSELQEVSAMIKPFLQAHPDAQVMIGGTSLCERPYILRQVLGKQSS